MIDPTPSCFVKLLYCHRDRLKAWNPDDELTRKLGFLNEGRRKAVDQRTELANEIKSQLKVYFPLALQVFDNNCSTAPAADLLLIDGPIWTASKNRVRTSCVSSFTLVTVQ
jgi:hypothetical protein